MGKAVKKSTKVDAAPAGAVAVPNKSAKKGKRDNTEEPIEKLVNAKKQKLDVKAQQAIQKKINKKEEPSSSDESASESEDEEDAPPLKQPAIDASDESDASDDEEPKVSAASKKAPVKNGKLTASQKPSTQVKKATVVPKKADDSSDASDESEAESDDEEAPAAEGSSESEAEDEKPAQAAKEDNASDEESSEDNDEDDSSEDEEEQPSKTPKKNTKGADEVMVDTKTPKTPQGQSGQSKTLFIGNLPFSVEQSDVEKFFKDVGEIVEVRLASDSDGTFRGFGHVDFATPEAAKKALELNGQPLLGRNVKLDLAKDRTAKTPASGGGGDQGLTIFVRGFDPSGGEEKVRSLLEEHFGPCGDITRIHIPMDRSTNEVKGIAYMDFSDKESLNKALEFNGEELGGDHTLTVEEARPRSDNRDGGRGGRRGGGRGFGGGRGGGGRGGGGRGFGGGRGGGGRGGGGRGFGGGRGGRRGGGGGRMNRFD